MPGTMLGPRDTKVGEAVLSSRSLWSSEGMEKRVKHNSEDHLWIYGWMSTLVAVRWRKQKTLMSLCGRQRIRERLESKKHHDLYGRL